MSGKGSAPRPFSVTDEQFAEAWARIFNKPKPVVERHAPNGDYDEITVTFGDKSIRHKYNASRTSFEDAVDGAVKLIEEGQGESQPELNSERREPDCQGQGTA